MRKLPTVFLSLFVVLAAAACGHSKDECSCDVENQEVQRLLACGESACIGGTQFTCSASAEVTTGEACTP